MKRPLCLLLVITFFTGCATRSLQKGEVENLEYEYGKNLDYELVEVRKRSVNENEEFQKALEEFRNQQGVNDLDMNAIQTRPFVINNTIYYPKSFYSEDFSKLIGDSDYDWSTFVHENCHAMYNQLKIPSKKHGNKPYTWRLGLWEQLTLKDPYEIPSPSQIQDSDVLTDFGFEQQCQIFQMWALYKHTPYVEPYGILIREMLNKYGVEPLRPL